MVDRKRSSPIIASTRACRNLGFARNGSIRIGIQIEAYSCNWFGAFGQKGMNNGGVKSISGDKVGVREN